MKNYIMIGAGGTGTHLLAPLVAYLKSHHSDGEWMLHVVDGDVVETKNLERQLFKDTDVTLNKAVAAVAPFRDGRIRAVDKYLSEENIERLILEEDTILICADNFTVRKRIEDHCLQLKDCAVINGGNEKYSGSVQLWVRAGGENLTPKISFLHPEVTDQGPDRATMTCAQAAALPGGEQTIIANLQSAVWMLTALHRLHSLAFIPYAGDDPQPRTWTELQFDINEGTVEHIDQRMSSYWRTA